MRALSSHEIKDQSVPRDIAETRPAAYLGDVETAHRMAVGAAIRLALRSHAFEDPIGASVSISPTQFIVRAYVSALKREVESRFSWGEKTILYDGWSQENEKVIEEYSRDRDLDTFDPNSWIAGFGSSTGPHLLSPILPLILADSFFFSIRTHLGIWCQAFKENIPATTPFLSDTHSPIGYAVGAALSPNWFLGLPFTMEDVAILSESPDLNVIWHPENDLITPSDVLNSSNALLLSLSG